MPDTPFPESPSDDADPFDALLSGGWLSEPAVREPSAAEREREAHTLQKKFQREGRRTRRRNRLRGAKKSLKPFVIPMIFVAILGSFLYAQYSGNDAAVNLPGQELDQVTTLRIVELVPRDKGDLPSDRQQIISDVNQMLDWFASEPVERPSGKAPRVNRDDGGAPKVERIVVDESYANLSATVHPSLDLSAQLDLAGFELNNDEAVIVFARIVPLSPICGEAGGRYAFVFRGKCSDNASEYSSEIKIVMAHELLHVLGAVDECAPHHGRGGHVTDKPTDIMYEMKDALAAPSSKVKHLDPGLDDYWGINKRGCPDLSKLPIWVKR